VRNEELLRSVKEERNIIQTINRSKAKWIGRILRRNCLRKNITEGNIVGRIEVTERQERRRKKLLDDLKEKTGYRKLKDETLDRTL
jgi:hypothetical protein